MIEYDRLILCLWYITKIVTSKLCVLMINIVLTSLSLTEHSSFLLKILMTFSSELFIGDWDPDKGMTPTLSPDQLLPCLQWPSTTSTAYGTKTLNKRETVRLGTLNDVFGALPQLFRRVPLRNHHRKTTSQWVISRPHSKTYEHFDEDRPQTDLIMQPWYFSFREGGCHMEVNGDDCSEL